MLSLRFPIKFIIFYIFLEKIFYFLLPGSELKNIFNELDGHFIYDVIKLV